MPGCEHGDLATILAWKIGWVEIVVIVVLVLLLFGGRKLPELARSLGKGLREFRKELKSVKDDTEPDETKPPDRPAE